MDRHGADPAGLDAEACYRAVLARDARFDGRFFTCVRTTGIYCRPICPSRTPKRGNVIFASSAEAAEAGGFRPCRRCRPETAPRLGAWLGTQASVGRAMALIEAGALDSGDVEDLAARLGMGGRQLRRLFATHLGTSPQAMAATRRALFARQLIAETGLSMAEIALAAGFGSQRRFNDAMRARYGTAPSALRRAARGRDADGGDGGAITLTLAYSPPFDWDSLIGFLAPRAIPGVETVRHACYARSIRVGDAVGTISVRHAPARHGVAAAIRLGAGGLAALPLIVAGIRRIFDLGADPATIGAALGGDALLAPLVARRPGLRVPGAFDGVELAVRAILGQQVSVAGATTLAGRLVTDFGTALPAELRDEALGLTHVFPAAGELADADIAAAIGLPKARGAAINTLAAAVARDPGLLAAGRDAGAAITRLTALRGIGDWTAQYVAMRALAEPDAFPAGDLILRRALGAAGKDATAREATSRAAAWRPWRAYAAMHLWREAADRAASARTKDKDDDSHSRPDRHADRRAAARL